MLRYFFRFLGVAPEANGKSGKRETAWTLVLIAVVLTIASMWQGTLMVQAMTAVLLGIWASAIAAIAGAYKLEHDKGAWKQDRNTMGEPVPQGWPPGVAAPEGYAGENDGEP